MEARKERVLVVLHAYEKELLQEAARKRGLTMASFVRSASLDAANSSIEGGEEAEPDTSEGFDVE